MKKILLPLFLIATIMETTRLNAYCVYNWSKSESITIKIFEIKANNKLRPKASYDLKPNGGKKCWNWKSIDENNRKKEWYWKAYSSDKDVIIQWPPFLKTERIGEGRFPIGGTVTFAGYDENARAKFTLNYDGKPWEYRKSPWNHQVQPWKTYKR